MAWSVLVTLNLFSVTYAGLALGRAPGLRMDRAGIALVGASLFLVTGLVSFDEAVKAIDHETLVLLFAMMIVVAYLRLAGFFECLAQWVLARFRQPMILLAVTVLVSGLLSAFLVNDVVCLALTPLVIQMTRRLRLPPLPYLMGLATASNIGSAATITGNPQNMIIGSMSHISFLQFATRLGPVAMLGLAVDFALLALLYRGSLHTASLALHEGDEHFQAIGKEGRPASVVHRRLLVKSVAVTLAAVALFFLGFSVPLVALGAAAILLLGRVRPEKIHAQVDWGLLVMFAGLFVVVRAFEANVIRPWGLEHWHVIQEHPVSMLSLASAGLSNIVSNVPAVLLFKPIILAMSRDNQESAWLALAMSSTFAGNLTVLGSVANLIVVELARRDGISISFWEYCRVGVPLTAATLLLGVLCLQCT